MNKELIKFEPVLIIETFNGDMYFIPATQKEKLHATIRSEKFIELNGELLNTSQIKRVYIDEYGISGLNRAQRIELENKKKNHEEKMGKKPGPQTIQNYVLTILGIPH